MMLPRFISCCLLAFVPVHAGAEVVLSASEKGIQIGAGVMGSFSLPAPDLVFKGGRTEKGMFQKGKEGFLGVATYPSGATLEYTASEPQGQLNVRFAKMPKDTRSLRFTMNVPIRFNQGGLWAFDEAEPRTIPSKMEGQFVQAGNAKVFHVISPMGDGITIQTPGGWQGLQDNRVFNWQVYSYIYQFDFGERKDGNFSFVIKERANKKEGPKFLVDRFGQSAVLEYPGKVTDEKQLLDDALKQKKESRSPGAAALDEYGGLANSGAKYGLKKTGFFHTAKVGNRDVLVTPAGNIFFHNGVCTLKSVDDYTTVKGRERIYEAIPPKEGPLSSAWKDGSHAVASFYIANWVRKYGKPYTYEEWLGQAIDRLRAWGFNSCGSFTGFSPTFVERNFPYVMNLGVESTPGVQALPGKIGAGRILDPFAPGTEEALSNRYSSSLAARAKEPLVIGYYLGNEQHFESLPKLIPAYKSNVAAKVRLVQTLSDKYGSIGKFNEAWKPKEPFASFKELEDAPLFVTTEQAANDMREFFRLFLETYYGTIERAFRKHDPNHMIIGSRWTPGTASNEDVVRIGGKHVDVVSVNYYTYAIEPAFLERVHKWSGDKPIILSEWHFSVTDNGLAGSREVGSQKERGLAYRNYIEQSVALPFVVGSEWFSYLDQSITGRFFEGFNGEGNNIGLVNVVDRPYQEFVSQVQFTNERIYDVMLGKEKAFAFDDPRFSGANANGERVVSIPKALPGMKLDGTTTGWPGRPAEPIAASRLALGTPNPNLRGDFRLCWDAANLYFFIQVKDATPGLNLKENANLWLGDAVELFIGGATPEKRGSPLFNDRHILIGAGAAPRIHVVDHPEENGQCKVIAIKDVTGDGYVVQCTIPWKVLGIEASSGKEFRFDVAIDNSDDGLARKQQLVWNGNAKNSADRALWGKARLTDN